jgi:tetratricopeptide (TPR) repeat protein
MTLIACLMMQKDEDLLLRPWLLYHGYLFGFENLFVFDNGSKSTKVFETLREFAAIGVHVDLSFIRKEDFENKGAVIGGKIAEFKNSRLYDIAIPLDCDEFLAINDFNHGILCSRNLIRSEIDRIYRGGVVCRVTHCLDNRPGHFDIFRYANHLKSVVVVRKFIGIDHGFHEADIPRGKQYGVTSLMQIHMHFKPFDRILSSARDKLQPYVDVADPNALKDFRGVGVHLTRYFSISASDYYLNLHGYNKPALRFRGLARLLSTFMDVSELRDRWELGRPDGDLEKLLEIDLDRLPFVASSYLAANPDLPPIGFALLEHFVTHGYSEGRTLELTNDGFAEAAHRLARMRERRGDGSLGYRGLALALSRLGKATEAEHILSEAFRQYGRKEGLLREHALLAEFEERFDEAASRWSSFRERFPKNVDGFHYGTKVNLQSGNLAEAEEIVLAGLARFPKHLDLSIQYANIVSARGEWSRAQALWDAMPLLDPENQQLREMADAAIADLKSRQASKQASQMKGKAPGRRRQPQARPHAAKRRLAKASGTRTSSAHDRSAV